MWPNAKGKCDLRQSPDFEDIIYILDNNPDILTKRDDINLFLGFLILFILLFNHHKDILVGLFHQELFASVFLQVLLVGGEFTQAGRILLNLLQVILSVFLQLIDLR